jgi:hypothetical protein
MALEEDAAGPSRIMESFYLTNGIKTQETNLHKNSISCNEAVAY